MMPPHSCAVPGRNPGTSTNVTSGMLKQSQKRTKRAAFTDASMSRQPARCAGWFATRPTGRPSRRANATMMLRAWSGWISNSWPSSTTRASSVCMSYGFDGSAGTRSSSAASARSALVARRQPRRILAVVLRQERRAACAAASRHAGSSGNDAVRDARPRVRRRAAQLLLRHLLVRDGADDVGPGDEHVAGRFDHEHEVGDRGRIDGAARARPQHRRQLRHHARRQRVAQEDVGVAGQRHDALLDARAARVVEADDGRARLHRQVHHLADLARVRLGQRAAEHGEVLREQEHRPPVDGAVAGDDAVAQRLVVAQAEVGRPVGDQLVDLDEAAGVAHQVDALARGQLAGLVLARDALRAARARRLLLQRFELRQARPPLRVGAAHAATPAVRARSGGSRRGCPRAGR